MRRETDGVRRFVRAAVLGSVIALAVDVLLLAAGYAGLTGSGGAAATLLDVQARAFLGGHLAVDPTAAGIEGFVTNGKTFLYFGPVPSLLHLPFLAIGGHGVDGHLTQLSMAAAYAVLLAATGVLHWRVRRLLRPDAPVGRTDAACALLLQVAVGAGAIPLYLAGWVAVYHEVELWGAALTIAALAVLVGFLRAPTVRGAVWAGVLATLAVNTRLSVGLAAVAALGATGLAISASMLAARLAGNKGGWPARALATVGTFGPSLPAEIGAGGPTGSGDASAGVSASAAGSARRGRLVLALLLAALVPIVTSAAINQLKFDQPFSLPLERQVISHIDPGRETALAANPDGLFGLKFVPTALLQYARPDAIGLARAFPFVSTPADPPTVVGDVRFDTLEPSLSAPTSMLLFCLLSLVALIGLLRPSRRPLWTVFVTSSVGLVAGLTLAYVTTRYLADLLPCLVVGAAAGLQLLIGRTADAAPARAGDGRRRKLLVAGVGALVVVGFVVNGSTGLLTQQLLHPSIPMGARADFVRQQDDVDRRLGRAPHGVRTGAVLPATLVGAPGDLFVVGRCEGLYTVPLSGSWLPVERTAATGLHPLSVRFPATTNGKWQPLATIGAGPSRLAVDVRGAGTRWTARASIAGHPTVVGHPFTAAPGRPTPMTVSTEPLFDGNATTVAVRGLSVLLAPGPTAISPIITVGRDPTRPSAGAFTGTVHARPTTAPVCHRLTARVNH